MTLHAKYSGQNDPNEALHNNNVGPVVRAGDVAHAVVEAAEIDNPDKEIIVDDKLAYVRVMAEDELILKRETLEECLGRPFRMQDLEVNLSSFAGQIEMDSDRVRFYFKHHI
ncbi:MmoB/DmpM family protein [Thiolapillus brandeum]|uniref:Toluene-4-monooxygenase system protein D n=1 Tax=Thiolapillus brandeum TaxID=1076588 RepID=A0A7U6JGZ1_9GAMM|nr:MmoB/DmpM family protein [Thiolapillus brandeum]BAO43851.1 toluene-4-monooxygenase system protein D [Thiolapillus brandeum]